jgi:hypothetical protein
MINANKKRMANIIIIVTILTLFSNLALAANNPGHDSLYIEEIGNSTITGRLNITDFVTLEGSLYLKSYLDLIANGTTISSSPSRNTLVATNTYLQIDAVSGGSLFLDRYGGTVFTGSPSARTDLNISGNLYIYNPTGYTTLTVGNVAVCLANGTNCPAIAGSSSAGGWTNTTTTTSTSLDVNVDTGTLYVDSTNNRVGIGDTSPGYTAEIQNLLSNIQLKVTGANSTGGIQLGTYISLQGSIDVDNNFHRGLLGQGVYYDQQNNTYNLTNQQWDRAALEFLNSGHIAFFTESQDRSATPYLTPTQWNSLERMRITNTGLVGINTKTPSSTLQVNGTANVTYLIITNNTAASCDLKADTRGNVYCGTDATGSGGDGSGGWTNTSSYTTTTLNINISNSTGSSVIFINSTSGKIGIGTTTPSAYLQVGPGAPGTVTGMTTGPNATFLEIDGHNIAPAAGASVARIVANYGGSITTDTKAVGIYGRFGGSSTANLTTLYVEASNAGTGGNYPAVFAGGNVGIGDSTPDHLLDVAGNIGMTASSYINWGDTDGTTGYGLRDNSGTIEFKNSGGAWAAIPSSASGGGWTDDGTVVRLSTSSDRVGIGTSNPARIFQIEGTDVYPLINATSQEAALYLNSPTGSSKASLLVFQSGGANMWGVGLSTHAGHAPSQFGIYESASASFPRLVIQNNTGYVGIGTPSPNYILDVNGSVNLVTANYYRAAGIAILGLETGTVAIGTSQGYNITMYTNSAIPRLKITTDGNVGIGLGVTGATSTLQINGTTNTTYLTIANNTASNCDLKADTKGNVYCGTDANNGGVGNVTLNAQAGYIPQVQNATQLNNSAIYQSGSNVGISTTTPNYKLDVNGSINLPISNYYRSEGIALLGLETGTVALGTSQSYNITMYTNSAIPRLKITTDGNVGIGLGVTGATSTLQINGTTNTTYLTISSATAASCDLKAYTNGTVYCGSDANSGGTVTGTGTGGYITQFQSASAINSSVIYQNGTNIGIGTTTPSDKLSVVGNINVTGNVLYGGNLTGYGADFAERFTMAEAVFAGDVVCLTKAGSIKKCTKEGDSSVVGVVSEQPTIIGNALAQNSVPVGIVGIVTTKVVGPVEQFDLLTTSSRKGYAQTAELEDFGSILGKAMEACKKNECQIKVLVGLR